MIRDGLVEKIWEGTRSVLALDVIRACRGGQPGKAFAHVSFALVLPLRLVYKDVISMSTYSRH